MLLTQLDCDYAALAELLAGAVEADPSGAAQAALNCAAATLGANSAPEAASTPRPIATRPDPCGALPGAPPAATNPPRTPTGLSGCATAPSTASPPRHRQLVCGANHAMLQALTDQVDSDPPTVRAALDPQPGRCCVISTREG
jgi:hypothetical protein